MVKTANPFVPTISLVTVPQRNRRRWVKLGVLSVLGGQAVLLLVLLAYDYQSELSVRARSAGNTPDVAALQSRQSPSAVQPRSANPAATPTTAATPSASRPTADASLQTARGADAESASPAVGRAEIAYTVRSGDTLSQIARLYGTTVKAIKTSNKLTTERLAVGTKLRLPDAKFLGATASEPGSLQ
jgi:LysM repeat protein